MGLTTQYLRFVASATFGTIINSEGQAIFVEINNIRDRYIASTSCEDVILWDLKTKKKLAICKGERSEALRLLTLTGGLLVVGYNDGAVKLFSFEDGFLKVTLQGHKAAVTSMVADASESKLVTAGKDGVIIVWDVINECGLYRLRGHKGPITQVKFMSEKVLVSSSKDTFVKFWDLDTQHCFHTLIGHRSEIWDFIVLKEKYLVTGTSAHDLIVWKVDLPPESVAQSHVIASIEKNRDQDIDRKTPGVLTLTCERLGTILRQGKGRTCGLQTEPHNDLFFCYGQDNQFEVFKILSETEVRKRHAKRIKRETTRKSEEDEFEVAPDITVSDLFRRLGVIRCEGKLSGLHVQIKGYKAFGLVALKNNSLDVVEFSLENEHESVLRDTLRAFGHRSDVRTLCFTSDNAGILSCSAEQLKLWSAESLQCIRSIDCEYACCSGFLLGDRHCVIGTRQGNIQLFDLAAGELIETIPAHEGLCASLCFTPDKKFLVTGGNDKKVKFWSIEIDESSRKFTLKLSRCLELPEEITYLKLSPNGELLAVALSDNTIKVFFVDSLKFFLSLYGHRYPVLCMDISYDSRLLVSGSTDRSVKIWGLDFGDCHKSIFAHTDSVMGVEFLSRSYQFFSVGKDKMLKHWDGENFQRIVTLQGHQAEVWALAVSPNGKHVVTAGHDRSLRIWNKTNEPLILEEQRELEREEETEKDIETQEEIIPREGETHIGLAGRKSLLTIKHAERLIEAINVFEEEERKEQDADQTNTKKAPPHPLLLVHRTHCRFRYLAEEIKRITTAEIEETLTVVPFKQVTSLLKMLVDLIERGWEVELMSRTLLFLVRIHSGQLLAASSITEAFHRAQEVLKPRIKQLIYDVAFNSQALSFIKQEIESRSGESAFVDATGNFINRRKKARKIRDQSHVVSFS